MSLLPILLDDLLQEQQERNRLRLSLYDGFGLGAGDDDWFRGRSRLSTSPFFRSRLCPMRFLGASGAGENLQVSTGKDGFKVNLDVQQFKPDEIKVKIVDDYLVVEAKHEERSDQHGFISRAFTRRYKLPSEIDTKALVSKLSSDGVLTLEAPKLVPENSNVREIPITHTGTPALPRIERSESKQSEKDGEQ